MLNFELHNSGEGMITSSCLRVLFVGQTYVVGVNQGKLDAVAATGKAEVGLLVPDNWWSSGWQRTLVLEKPYPRLRLYAARVMGLKGRVGAYFFPPWTVRHALLDFRPDIIHVHQEVFSLTAFELALLARLTHKPLVIECAEDMDRQLLILRRWSREFVLNTARLIVTYSHSAVQLLRSWNYKGPIEVIPHLGVNISLFTPQSRMHVNNQFTIGFLGRLVYEKGLDVLLAAARRLREQGHRYQIIVCGTGPDEEVMRREAEKQGVTDLVTWRAAIPHKEVPEQMSKFDVLVLPSRTIPKWKEQFGNVLIEAMAMGIPAIGSTCGHIPYVIGRPDLVFQEGDAEGLAAILERMIREPAWREEVGQYGITRVRQHYTHECIAERLISLWSEMLDQKSEKTRP